MFDFFKSFGYALKGIGLGLKQRNFIVQVCCAVITIALGFWFDIMGIEWCLLLLCIGLVLSLEMLNSAIEYIVNMISPGYHETAGKIKDLAAGAVLVVSCGSLTIAIVIFKKYFILYVLF
jgi:diacylglycerol kinase